jgi:hypothetical protein
MITGVELKPPPPKSLDRRIAAFKEAPPRRVIPQVKA